MKRLVAIIGPTGIGKSRLALHLARIFHGEIISADSRQVYRYMDIGTAKPSPADMSLVPHHLIDILEPDDDFSLAQYLQLANKVITRILNKRGLPVLVGGTGLYVKAVLEGWQVPRVSPDREFRYNKEKQAGEGNTDELYNELLTTDADAAVKIDRRNVRRVIRALEVRASTGQAFSQLGRKKPPVFSSLVIGLTTDRAGLYRMVDQRVDDMFARGFVEEVRNLQKTGFSLDLPSMSGIGYRQIGQFLRGEPTLEEAKQKIKTETHRFIRHQYAWFRRNDTRIHWFDVKSQPEAEIEKLVSRFLESTDINRKRE
jgi:tRNA dimethylallyltransferase